MKRKLLRRGIFVFSLIVCVLCLTKIVPYMYEDIQTQKEYEDLRDQVVKETTGEKEKSSKKIKTNDSTSSQEKDKKSSKKIVTNDSSQSSQQGSESTASQQGSESTASTQNASNTQAPTLEEVQNVEFTGEREGEAAELPDNIFSNSNVENPINFQTLSSINSDIYAWIRIPSTEIDYPIAQRAGDDAYYLSHDIYQKPRFAGCIYTEDCNSKDFTDPNTVIYGHNMKNKSMFQNLHKFEDKNFFESNPYVYIYTSDKVLIYEIFAAYTYDDRHIMDSFNFEDKSTFEKYLQNIKNMKGKNRNIRDISVTADDKIITLSTCAGGQTSSRYLVQAVLIQG